MLPPFYRAFEDRHRGTRELIKKRQHVYLPFILPLQSIYTDCKAIDVGCGRGEWLEILIDNGFDPKGIDLDDGMLEICHQLALPAEHGDAIVALQNQPDESLTLVSGFHLAEHIPFESLQTLVAEALRALKPAGILILETPNAENITVGTHTFYLDPTHEKPIPYLLLSFLTEYTGFKRSKVLRLQESSTLMQSESLSLMDVFEGASPDYAVVAQKKAPAKKLALFNEAFNQDYGLALDQLAGEYEQALRGRFAAVNERVNSAQSQQQALEHQQQALERQQQSLEGHQKALEKYLQSFEKYIQVIEKQQQMVAELQARFEAMSANTHHWHELAQVREAQLQAAFNSKSWRITQPLRSGASLGRQAWGGAKLMMKQPLKYPLQKSMRFVLARPGLRNALNQRLQRYPRLYSRLVQFARNRGLVASWSSAPVAKPIPLPLTPQGQHIYTALKQAIKD